MTEKVGLIKNPLTIIAIFAGIAEVSGTIVLPFISPANQALFIYFLILFPSLLVILFFVTLNFNNKVLYAPSDYKDETNYIQVNKYDLSKQKTIEVTIPKQEANNDAILVSEKLNTLSASIVRLESAMLKTPMNKKEIDPDLDLSGYEFMVSNFENAASFVKQMKKVGVDFNIYTSPGVYDTSDYSDHEAIWLGPEIPLKLAQLVIKKAKEFYPHLKYIKLSDPGDQDHYMIYIGGATESAVDIFKRVPLKSTDFEKLETFSELDAFHSFIDSFSKKR